MDINNIDLNLSIEDLIKINSIKLNAITTPSNVIKLRFKLEQDDNSDIETEIVMDANDEFTKFFFLFMTKINTKEELEAISPKYAKYITSHISTLPLMVLKYPEDVTPALKNLSEYIMSYSMILCDHLYLDSNCTISDIYHYRPLTESHYNYIKSFEDPFENDYSKYWFEYVEREFIYINNKREIYEF